MKNKLYKINILLIVIFSICKTIAQINPNNNFIGLDVSTYPQNSISFNYDSCFMYGKSLGMERVGLTQTWTAIETAPLIYNLVIFDIANYYYSANNMAIDLTIAPINTNKLEVPSDLTNISFNSNLMINRFNILLDSIKVHVPNLTISSLVIGSEHDVYLGANASKWAEYTVFYDSVSLHARKLWPGLKIASELTFNGIVSLNTYAQILNTNSDYIGLSYYPLNNDFTVKPTSAIPFDFSTLVGLYPSKPICFYQYGYPSSPLCNSSETLQAQFITQTFTSWDLYASNIKMIDFTWLNDLSVADVNYYGTYYGITDQKFLSYLASLGLRTWDGNGTNKMAFIELQCQAKQRGYNSLPITCTTSINEDANIGVRLFPNPTQKTIQIESPNIFNNAEVKIVNQLGECVDRLTNINGHYLSVNTSSYSSGVYTILIQNEKNVIKDKFLVIE